MIYGSPRPFTALIGVALFALSMLQNSAFAADLDVRSWIDEKTAASVTAQQRPLPFTRNDVQAGVMILYYAELGAFEINQSGKRRQYLCLQESSTATRPILHKSRIVEEFSTLNVWADDQLLSFKRLAQSFDALPLSADVFKRPISSTLENYYEVTIDQLEVMSQAKMLRLAASNHREGAELYRTPHDDHSTLNTFTTEVANIAKMANPKSAK